MPAPLDRRALLRLFAELAFAAVPLARGVRLSANGVELQPLLAQVRRVLEAMDALGEPFAAADVAALTAAENSSQPDSIAGAVERLLGARCLVDVRVNPEGRVSVSRGPAAARLVEQGWRAFLVKVHNEAAVTGRLAIESPQARPVYRPATGNAMAPPSVRPADIVDRWLAVEMFDDKPLEPQLSGLAVEYRVVTLYSRDRGQREAQLGATVGSGSEDIGFRNRVAILFQVDPSEDVTIRVRDEHGRPAIASLIV